MDKKCHCFLGQCWLGASFVSTNRKFFIVCCKCIYSQFCTVHNNYYYIAHCIQIGAKGFLDTKESSRTTKERGTCTVNLWTYTLVFTFCLPNSDGIQTDHCMHALFLMSKTSSWVLSHDLYWHIKRFIYLLPTG